MIDREKVIKGLECCMVGDEHSPKCELCPYATVGDDTCQTMDALFADTLALLKAQEPRVMTLEEVLALDNDTPVYIQDMSRGSGWDIYHRGIENNITHDIITGAKWVEGECWDSRTYGRRWRCWTSRPTDEQKKAVKWV